MKKIISLILGLILGCFLFSGCSNSSEPFKEKSYTPDAQIKEVCLDVRRTDKLKCQYQRTVKSTFPILRIARKRMTLRFQMNRY